MQTDRQRLHICQHCETARRVLRVAATASDVCLNICRPSSKCNPKTADTGFRLMTRFACLRKHVLESRLRHVVHRRQRIVAPFFSIQSIPSILSISSIQSTQFIQLHSIHSVHSVPSPSFLPVNMATAHRILIPVHNTGLWKPNQDEETAAKVMELLQDDFEVLLSSARVQLQCAYSNHFLQKHHVFFNSSGFHNHVRLIVEA